MQQKGILSKSHGKLSAKQSDDVKKYGIHEAAPFFPFKFWTKINKKPENVWRETPIRKRDKIKHQWN